MLKHAERVPGALAQEGLAPEMSWSRGGVRAEPESLTGWKRRDEKRTRHLEMSWEGWKWGRGCRLERNQEDSMGRGGPGHKECRAWDAAVQLGGCQSPSRAPARLAGG